MSLCGFGMGMVLPLFHMCGMLFVLSTVLYRWVRCRMAIGPRCLRCLMLMLSGPVELLFRCCCSAACVCVVVMFMSSLRSFLVCLSVFLFVLCVLCVMFVVNCLLKCCAFCLSVIAILELKVMVLLCCGFVFVLFSPAMVFHSLCGFVLWSHASCRCSTHNPCLCFCICLSISVLSCFSLLSVWFCCLMLLRCVISCLMCSGSSLCLFLILPCGMLCLSACSKLYLLVYCLLCVGCLKVLCRKARVRFPV